MEDVLKSLKEEEIEKKRELDTVTQQTVAIYPERIATRRREEQLRMDLKILQQQLIQRERE